MQKYNFKNGSTMQLDKKTAIANAESYAKVVAKELNPRDIMLFGSYANGNWNEHSDIDVAVVVDAIAGDFLDLSKKLNRLTRGIDNRIEPILLLANNDPSGFLSTVLSTGIPLYQR